MNLFETCQGFILFTEKQRTASMDSLTDKEGHSRMEAEMRIPSWLRGAIVAGLMGAVGCQAENSVLPPDGQHRVETVSLSAELESLGGIGGVSVDTEGNIILANFNKYVWRISPEGDVQVLADHFTAASGNTVLRNGDILQ